MRNSYFWHLVKETHESFLKYLETQHKTQIYEDIFEPMTYDNMPEPFYYDDDDREVPYTENEVLLSPKSFYNNIVTESFDFDYSLAKKPAVHSMYTIRCIARELGIAADKYFKPVYFEDRNATIAAFIMYKSYTAFDYESLAPLAYLFADKGYFLAKTFTRNENGLIVYLAQFEPYYFENERICISEPLWHMTRKIVAEVILKTGFRASHQSSAYDYPARNYFFLSRNIKLMIGLMYAGGKFAKGTNGRNSAVIFKIDNKKVKDIHFYTDPVYYNLNILYIQIIYFIQINNI